MLGGGGGGTAQRGRHARAGKHKTQASRVSGDLLFPTGLSSAGLHSQIGWFGLQA